MLSTFYLVLCVDKASDIPRAKVTVICLATPPQWVAKHRVQKQSGRKWRFRAQWKILPFLEPLFSYQNLLYYNCSNFAVCQAPASCCYLVVGKVFLPSFSLSKCCFSVWCQSISQRKVRVTAPCFITIPPPPLPSSSHIKVHNY